MPYPFPFIFLCPNHWFSPEGLIHPGNTQREGIQNALLSEALHFHGNSKQQLPKGVSELSLPSEGTAFSPGLRNDVAHRRGRMLQKPLELASHCQGLVPDVGSSTRSEVESRAGHGTASIATTYVSPGTALGGSLFSHPGCCHCWEITCRSVVPGVPACPPLPPPRHLSAGAPLVLTWALSSFAQYPWLRR